MAALPPFKFLRLMSFYLRSDLGRGSPKSEVDGQLEERVSTRGSVADVYLANVNKWVSLLNIWLFLRDKLK